MYLSLFRVNIISALKCHANTDHHHHFYTVPGNQLGPSYEGQLILMADPIPHPKRPPRTPSRRSSFFASDGRAETDS